MQDQVVVAPPQAQAPPAPAPSVPATPQISGSPRAMYQAVQEKREVLGDQMSRLLNRRNNVAERLNSPNLSAAEKGALEQHMTEINGRIVDMEKLLHASDAEVAAAAGVPGAATPAPRNSGPVDEDMIGVAIVFAGISLVIVSLAYARRMWKGVSSVVAQFPPSLDGRLTRMEEAIDTVAIEVERVSEGQRFMSKMFIEHNARALATGAAQPIEQRERVAEPVSPERSTG